MAIKNNHLLTNYSIFLRPRTKILGLGIFST